MKTPVQDMVNETANKSISFRVLLWISLITSFVFFVFATSQKSWESFGMTLLISTMYTFGYGLSNGFLNDTLSQKYSWITQTNQRLWWGIFGTVVVNVVMTYVLNYLNFVVIQGQSDADFFSPKMNFTHWFFINFALMMSAILHARGFMLAMKQNAKEQVVEQKIIATSANAQLESLKNQLDPHFLFNSLNVLSALIDENPAQAQKFTASMSKIYRYVLDQKDKEAVTVAEELEFAHIYAELLKTRFEDSVQFSFAVREEDMQKWVVPLSLQLLLENAIKHNFATSQKPLTITIGTENGTLTIENNLQSRQMVKDRDGIGLSNIVQRYALITPLHVKIEQTENYFKVKIPMLEEAPKSPKIETMKTDEHIAYDRALQRMEELKGFYGNLISYCVIIPILVVINLATKPQIQWFWWPMLGWGIGVASHAFQVFGIGKRWEEKKIKQLLKQKS